MTRKTAARPVSVKRLPGKTRSFLEASRFAQGIKARIPVLNVTGKRPGPRAVILANQHGREVCGIAACELAFNRLDPAAMSGEVIFLPVMNPVATRMQTQDFPIESSRYRPTNIVSNMNMNRVWPGGPFAEDASYAQSVVEAAWKSVVRRADLVVDLHGWTGMSLSLVWGSRRDASLVRAFGFPWHMIREGRHPRLDAEGLTETCLYDRGIPIVVCEFAWQNLVVAEEAERGARGILNVLREAGILKGRPERPPMQYEFTDSHVETVARAGAEGLLVSDCAKGDFVRKGRTIARVLSLESLETVWSFEAPHDGLLFNLGGTRWGEDRQDSFVVYPGQIVALLKKPTRILRNR
jgi:predicted deacylase